MRVFSVADDGNGVMTSPVCGELRKVQKDLEEYFLRTHDIRVEEVRPIIVI